MAACFLSSFVLLYARVSQDREVGKEKERKRKRKGKGKRKRKRKIKRK